MQDDDAADDDGAPRVAQCRFALLAEAVGVISDVASHFAAGAGSVRAHLGDLAREEQGRLARGVDLAALESEAAAGATGAHAATVALGPALAEKLARLRASEQAREAERARLAECRAANARLLRELELLHGEAGGCGRAFRGGLDRGRAYLDRLEASKAAITASMQAVRDELSAAKAALAQPSAAWAPSAPARGGSSGARAARPLEPPGSCSLPPGKRGRTRQPSACVQPSSSCMRGCGGAAAQQAPAGGSHGCTGAARPPAAQHAPRRNDAVVASPSAPPAAGVAQAQWQVTQTFSPHRGMRGFQPPLMRDGGAGGGA